LNIPYHFFVFPPNFRSASAGVNQMMRLSRFHQVIWRLA
jgi:hypothetical protein